MKVVVNNVKLTAGQQRVVKLLFKFRFVSSQSLAQVMSINRRSIYEVLEYLTSTGLVTKVYSNEFRIDRRPAYYCLSKSGVTTVRKLLNVNESVVHALYKNDAASDGFIRHCLQVTALYVPLRSSHRDEVDIYTKVEINRYEQFPKERPDLYIRTSDNQEAFVILADELTPYFYRKRLKDIIDHSENEGWNGEYPRICFVLKDEKTKQGFLKDTLKVLTHLGYDEDEITILGASLKNLRQKPDAAWSSPLKPKQNEALFE